MKTFRLVNYSFSWNERSETEERPGRTAKKSSAKLFGERLHAPIRPKGSREIPQKDDASRKNDTETDCRRIATLQLYPYISGIVKKAPHGRFVKTIFSPTRPPSIATEGKGNFYNHSAGTHDLTGIFRRYSHPGSLPDTGRRHIRRRGHTPAIPIHGPARFAFLGGGTRPLCSGTLLGSLRLCRYHFAGSAAGQCTRVCQLPESADSHRYHHRLPFDAPVCPQNHYPPPHPAVFPRVG